MNIGLDTRLDASLDTWIDIQIDTRINTRLMTSILNNMGHISYELREYGASRAYFEGLTSMVAQWNARQRQNSEEFKGLLLNAIVLRQPPAAASA